MTQPWGVIDMLEWFPDICFRFLDKFLYHKWRYGMQKVEWVLISIMDMLKKRWLWYQGGNSQYAVGSTVWCSKTPDFGKKIYIYCSYSGSETIIDTKLANKFG